MRLIFWVTALAVLNLAWAKTSNTTAKTKPKRQLDILRTPENLQYSLVLPHSRVQHYRSLGNNRRIANIAPRTGKLPPYAVQMEPVVQYSQKDPLYDPTNPNIESVDDPVNKNEIYAQAKILNVHGGDDEGSYGPPYGSLPTAPLYSSEPHYYEAPEPIIEIIIKESNETLPPPPPQVIPKKKKEPVQVFYVKYSKDPHSKDKVVYEKPVPAITPATNDEEDHHHQDYVTVTPEPYYIPQQTTTLRAIIKPDSEQYHSDSSVKVTFGKEGQHDHYSDRRESDANNEDHEETAPRPAIAHPQQPPNHPNLERSAHPTQQYQEFENRPSLNHQATQTYRQHQSHPQFAQNRIQFQQPFLPNEQQLPRQGPSVAPFRGQSHIPRQHPFGPSPSLGPITGFPNSHPGSVGHFPNGPNAPGPLGPVFPTTQPRPLNPSTFNPRPNSPPQFAPRPHFSGPPRNAFHSGPQRPFNQQPQSQSFFDEAKYLQENYHTITTEQVDPPRDQPLPNREPPNYNFIPQPQPSPSPGPTHFHENHRNPHIPQSQLLPQQRPAQQFADNAFNKPTFAATPSRSPFYNLKPSPPLIEENRTPFQSSPPSQQHFSFHQGVQPLTRPSTQIQNQFEGHRIPGPISPSSPPPTIHQSQFLPQPSAPPRFSFQTQPSLSPERPNHFEHSSPSERPPQYHSFNNPSERPPQFQTFNNPSDRPPQFQQFSSPSERPISSIHQHPSNFHDQANIQHQQNVGQFVPKGGELVAAIPKYEQHITVSGPTAQQDYSKLSQSSQPTVSSSTIDQQYQHRQQQLPSQQQQYQQLQEQRNREQQQLQQQQHLDAEQEQVRQQLAENVKKQQEEIQRLQSQLIIAQQQQQQQQQVNQYEQNYKQFQNSFIQQPAQSASPKPQYTQERSRPSQSESAYSVSTSSPPYYQSTSRTVEIKPTTQKYVSSTVNSISTTPETKKEEKKRKPTFELPDEVPDDLRQQLLSSGILDNADISILDYDKIGDTSLDSLPPDQLANFFSAGGAQQIAASENRPIIVAPNGDQIESRIDDDDDEDQEIAASENVPSYIAPTPTSDQAVEMKVVHFDPTTLEGKKVADAYVKEDATQLDPVALNDKKYNRYLPLKVRGNQFPLPDVLKGRKVTSVVVLAPVETEALNSDHYRAERATSNSLKGIKFVAGDSLQDLLKKPTQENFEKWLAVEKRTATDLQSVVLLVTGNEDPKEDREIFMYDIASGNVNKLNGELSNAFVEAAENNSLSKDIESLAIAGEGVTEKFKKPEDDDEKSAEASDNVPFLVDLSGLSINQEDSNQVSISSGYSQTKLGRSIRNH